MLKKYFFMTLLVFSTTIYAFDKEISITIDDLPFVGRSSSPGEMKHKHDRFNRILQALIDAHIPATGFVIAGAIANGQWQLLENFQKNGFIIGNHTTLMITLIKSVPKNTSTTLQKPIND